MDDEYKSTDEEKVDTSDDVLTDESSNIAPLWSPVTVFTTDTELNISLLSVEADSQDANITPLGKLQLPTLKLIGDNFDSYIIPQSGTADHHAKSKHFSCICSV